MDTVSENSFRDFFKDNADFLFILDMRGNIIEINNSVRTTLGYSDEELIGNNVLMVHPPEFREEAGEIVIKMIKGEKSSCPIPLLTKNKKYIPVETRVYPGTWNSQQVLIGVSRNLSELAISEEKFYRVFNISHVLMSLSDPKTGVFVNVNRQFLKTLGYTKEEIIGKSVNDLDMFTDSDQKRKAFEIFDKESRLDNFETVLKNKNGEHINCLFSMDNIRIQTIEYVLSSATDITQQKSSESKIKFLYRQQKLIADISQLLNDTTGFESKLNEVLRLIGEHINVSRVSIFENVNDGDFMRNTYEWCNTGIKSQIHELEDIPYQMIPSWKEMLLKNGFVFSRDINELPHDAFEVLNAHGIKSILIYSLYVENEFFGFIGFDDCISQKTWADEEIDLLKTVSNIISNAFDRSLVIKKLESSEMRLKLAMDSAKEGLWDWNNQTGYVYFNDNWCRMLDFEPEEIEPNVSSWAKLVHPDDMPFIEEALNKHFNGETEFYETIHRIKAKNGNWKWILDHGMVTQRDDKNQPIRTIGTHIDLTKLKEIEQQLQESVNTKNKLFSIIAHDLRGPIGNFLPVLELLTGEEMLNEIDKKEYLEEMKSATRTTLNLLDNLLSWSRSQTNTITLRPTHFVINNLIKDNIKLHSSLANMKGISISLLTDKEYSVFADKDSISLVLRNLLSNAIKFTNNNGNVTFSINKKDREIEIVLVDNGIGMKKEVVDNLFNTGAFYSTHGTNNEKGSGIGLTLCQDFIEKNGGRIRAESIPGKGSRFIVTLPATK